MKKIHYGWLVCLGCALLLFCTSGLCINAFTVYQPYILEQNNFTNAQSSMIITFRSLFSFLSMFVTGIYYKRFSLRKGMAMAGLLTLSGFVLFAFAASHFAYCLAAVAVGLGYGLGTMIPIAIVLEHWFLSKRNLAIGLCSAVTGVSTLGIPSLLTQMIETWGLKRTFLAESCCIAVLVLAAVLLIRDHPSQMGLEPYGAEKQAAKPVSAGRSLARKHWILAVPMLLLVGAMTSVAYSHLSMLISAEGFDTHITALAITVSGIMMTLGKFVFGGVSDKIGTYRCNWIFGLILICGLTLCCVMGNSVVFLFLAMCAYGTGLATTTVGLTAWAGDLSTPEQYDSNVQRFQLGYAAGTLLFSSLPGILADRFGGSYVPAYVFFAGCGVFVILSVQWLYRSTHSVKHKDQEVSQ